VGNTEQTLTLGNDVTTTTLHFDNPSRSNTLVIVPPDPQSTNEGNILGHSPRKLGIGMVEIKIVSNEVNHTPRPASCRAHKTKIL
jgi:phosphoglycerol transferase